MAVQAGLEALDGWMLVEHQTRKPWRRSYEARQGRSRDITRLFDSSFASLVERVKARAKGAKAPKKLGYGEAQR